MNYREIAAMLADGKSAEDIAKEFTDALNKATAEQKAAEEAKAKEDAKSKRKDEIAVAIAHALNEYALVAGFKNINLRGSDVREFLDEVMPLAGSLKDIKVKVSTTTPKVVKSIDDIFGDFFRELNI